VLVVDSFESTVNHISEHIPVPSISPSYVVLRTVNTYYIIIFKKKIGITNLDS
jgi:hypothetical protein